MAWVSVLAYPWRLEADTGKSTCPCHPSSESIEREKKGPVDAHRRGQFHKTHGVERLLLIVTNAVPSSLAVGGGSKSTQLFRTSPFGSSPSQPNSYENPPVIAGGFARIGLAHALERLRWDRLKSRFSFAQASGWQRSGKRCRALRLSRPRGSVLPLSPPDSGVVPFSGKSTRAF